MTRVYSIETSIHGNACESDNPEDIANWLIRGLQEWPLRTIVNVRIHELPTELWIAMPKFEGFQYGNVAVDTPGSD